MRGSSANILYANDRPATYPGSYYAATANPIAPFEKLDGDLRCDVCIVGGGYTGLSAALHLAECGTDVVLLDAHRVGWGASGRNGGQLGSGQRVKQSELERMLGKDHALALWQLAQESKSLTKALIAKHNIACDLKPGIAYAAHRAREVAWYRSYAETLNTDYGYDQIRFVDGPEFREMVGSPAYFGGTIDMGAGHLHPLNYALGLADAARAAGARIFEASPVERYTDNKQVVVKTASGSVVADALVLACNGYLGTLDKRVAARVMPINNYILATEPLGEDLAKSLIRDDVAVADSKFVVNYFRLSADHRLLFGGRESYSYQFPSDIQSYVRKPMVEIYPQLKDVRIDYGWGGTLAITMNRLPHIARLSDNVVSASGYSGHGVGMATLCGSLAAEMITGNPDRFNLMQDIPTPRFPGGRHLRWPLLVLAMTYYSIRDRI